MKNHTSIKDLELFFDQPVSEVLPEDATCIFVLRRRGMQIRIAVNEATPSFSTVMQSESGEEIRMEFEGLEELCILGDRVGPYLLARFSFAEAAQCIVRVYPSISVRWSFLR